MLLTQTLTVDLNDIAKPIKRDMDIYLADYFLKSDKVYSITFYLNQIQLELDDSLVGVWSQSQSKTISSLNGLSSTGESMHEPGELEMNIFKVSFIKSKAIEQYKRKVFNFFELTGILGGLFEIFHVGFGFLIGILSRHLFK